MVQATLYATDYTQKSPYWTFLIYPHKSVFRRHGLLPNCPSFGNDSNACASAHRSLPLWRLYGTDSIRGSSTRLPVRRMVRSTDDLFRTDRPGTTKSHVRRGTIRRT